MEILYAIGGLVIGLILGIWLGKLMSKSKAGNSDKEIGRIAGLEAVESELRQQNTELLKELGERELLLRSAEGRTKEAEATLTAERESLVEQRRLINGRAEDLIAAEREKMTEQKRLLDEAEQKLKASFTALAGDVLNRTNKQFLTLAEERFENKRKDVDKTIQPLTNALEEYRKQTSELKTTLDQQQSLISKLDTETGQLLDALKRPSVRGRWGEVTLKRLVELSGMSQYCDFTEQLTVEGEDGKLRPDMVIHLPNDRTLVIDAKTSADHYLKALETEDGDEQQRELKEFARTVKDRMRELGKKDYWKRFDRSPEFVIQFLPGESFFATALEHDHTLIEAGSAAGVMLSSPLTLMSLLLAVKQGWKEEALQENASKIAEQGKQLYDRLCTMTEHLESLGRSIANSMGHYNKLIGTVESRIVPTARRLNELDAATNKGIMPLEKREISMRSITVSELRPSSDDGSNGS
jgi:DNA recombination protein RmuC